MRTRARLTQENLVRLADLHQPLEHQNGSLSHKSRQNTFELKHVVDSKHSSNITEASCSNCSACTGSKVVWIGRQSGKGHCSLLDRRKLPVI